MHQRPPRHWIDDAEFETLQRWSKGHEQEQGHEENGEEGTCQDAEGKKGSEKAQEGRKEAPVMPGAVVQPVAGQTAYPGSAN